MSDLSSDRVVNALSLSLTLSCCRARDARGCIHEALPSPRTPVEYENIRLAVGQLAGFPPVVSLAGLLARTGRYLWIAIRGFIGIGRILRDTPARIVRALIICRLRRGIRAPCCHRWYRSSRPRIFTALRLEKSRPGYILSFSFSAVRPLCRIRALFSFLSSSPSRR